MARSRRKLRRLSRLGRWLGVPGGAALEPRPRGRPAPSAGLSRAAAAHTVTVLPTAASFATDSVPFRLQRSLATAALLALIAGSGGAQRPGPAPRRERDPYTRGDPAALRALGYVSYGPFAFGARGGEVVTTEDVERRLGDAPLIWVETAHFRIGSSLAAWRIASDRATRAKVRGELRRLKEKLPRVRARTRVLDPWLRLHLTALRMEETYARFRRWLGVGDGDFPRDESELIIGRRYMGQGPYLGQTGKYLVLVLERAAALRTYLETYVGRSSDLGHRWHFVDAGSLLYVTAAGSDGGRLRHDTALHANLVFNVVHNLVDGFRGFGYDLPVWITSGLAHYFEREVSPRWSSFDRDEGIAGRRPSARDWAREARRLVAAGEVTPFAELSTWREYGRIGPSDHVLIWSRWDFLMSRGPEPFAKFMFMVKGRVDPETWQPDPGDLVAAVRAALQEAYGLTPLAFDDAWKAWLKDGASGR